MISRRENSASRWALRSKSVALPDNVGPAVVVVDGERIAEVLPFTATLGDIPAEDVDSLLPGLVDTHVHINEPGRTEWEGFATATRAAAAGGITTLIDMPLNSSPVTTTVATLRLKQAAAKHQIRVDCGFHAGLVPGNLQHIRPLIDAGVCAFKAFLCPSGIDEFPPMSDADLRLAMPILAESRIPLFVHAELMSPLPPGIQEHLISHPRSYRAWLNSRPPTWEADAIRMMIRLCDETRCPVHIVHLSAAEECLPLIQDAKRRGTPITVETCPHYLNFCAEDIPDGNPLFKCAPPIRERTQRDQLRLAVANGGIDTIGSDHSPCPPEMKCLEDGDLSRAWGGIASLQFSYPLTRDLLERHCSDQALVRLFSTNPARLVGLGHRKGAIAPGLDADLVVFDGCTDFRVSPETLHHRHKQTPYLGLCSSGSVIRTYVRGQLVFDRGQFVGEPRGQLLERARP